MDLVLCKDLFLNNILQYVDEAIFVERALNEK